MSDPIPIPSADELRALRSFYGTYHNHKEQLAYAATVLYLGAATVVIQMGPKLRPSFGRNGPMILVSVITCLTALMFVGWQHCKRTIAADIVDGCNRLLSGTALMSDNPPTCIPGYPVLPAALVAVIDKLRTDRPNSWLDGPTPSRLLSLAALVVWTGIAAWSVFQ